MKKHEMRPRPAEMVKRLVCTTCDLCGRTSKGPDWQAGAFDAMDIEISMKTGTNYPEGGSGELVEIDICPSCFTDKLIPWVESQGGLPTKTEWDW